MPVVSARQLSKVIRLSSSGKYCVRAMSGERTSHILDCVNNIVQKHKLIPDKYDDNNKVVQFEHPKDLFNILPLDIGKEGVDDKQLEEISETIVKYSVKTCHPYFYNQLYHGADEYGLAGSWLSGELLFVK